MKKLTFIVAVLLMASCGNKKTEIVEQIKSYKDSAKLIQRDILDLTIDESKVYEDMFSTDGQVDLDKLNNSKLQRKYGSYEAGIKKKKWDLEFKKLRFQSKIDSLELELKKY